MPRPCVFALGLGIGGWLAIAAQHATARLCHRHYLN